MFRLHSKKIKTVLLTVLSFGLVLGSYLYLCSQSDNARMGVMGTFLYLLQYFIVFFVISRLQPKAFISPILGFINALLLFLCQIHRDTGGGLINFGWDWLLGPTILIIAIYNFIFSLGLIFVMRCIRKRKK